MNATGRSPWINVNRHEAGHVGVALELGMLGPHGLTIHDDRRGESSIWWDLAGLRQPERIRDRATVLMAGPAADIGLWGGRSKGDIDWTRTPQAGKEWEPDVYAACHWGWLADHHSEVSEELTAFLSINQNPTEEEIRTWIVHQPGFELDLPTVDKYFKRAQELLKKDYIAVFTSKLMLDLLGPGHISSADLISRWNQAGGPPRSFPQGT